MFEAHDEAGDVINELSYGGTDVQTFSYDARGEMIQSVLSGLDPGKAGMTETRQYDPDGEIRDQR